MANSFKYKDTEYKVGDTLTVNYKIKEGDKERMQAFKGILLKIKGDSDKTRMFTIRKNTRSGISVERIIPAMSPYIESIKLDKKSNFQKAKLYFIRDLSDQQLKSELYQVKKTVHKSRKTKTKAAK